MSGSIPVGATTETARLRGFLIFVGALWGLLWAGALRDSDIKRTAQHGIEPVRMLALEHLEIVLRSVPGRKRERRMRIRVTQIVEPHVREFAPLHEALPGSAAGQSGRNRGHQVDPI